jgi:hypothetical protein
MLDFEALSSGKPVPAVDASDMKRVWELTSEAPDSQTAALGAVSWDARLIAGQCSQGADPLAVFFRVTLLRLLLENGLLDEWLDGDRPDHIVFETLAAFPLPEGFQGFRPDEFIESLRIR